MSWSEEILYYDNDKYFKDLMLAIDNATRSIELESYIFKVDLIGKQILNKLISASERGLTVRLIIDWVGSYFSISEIYEYLKNSQVKIKIYRSFSWGRLFKLNRRLHRKTCILDGQSAFIGSFNVSNEAIRDTAVFVKGEEVETVLIAFEKVWFKRWSIFKNVKKSELVFLNDSYRARKFSNNKIADKIAKANRRVWITNAYFVPPPYLLKSIYLAAKNKVDLRLITPQRSNLNLIKWITEAFYSGLLMLGVRIYEYSKTDLFMHAKTLIIDDWMLVGSSNLSHRSLFFNLEVDVVLSHRNSLESLEKQFELDIIQSNEIFLTEFKARPILNKLILFFRTWI